MEKLRISENNRYFENADGSPFIWLADTAWTVPARLKWDDVLHYMKTRKEQGFTVLQMVVLDPEFNEEMRNPCGIKAMKDNDILQPNEAYFSYVDWVLDQAEAFGFYVLLLPVWGELVVGWDWSGGEHPVYVTEENAAAYGTWLGRRMAGRNNILWCLGGDRMPVCRGKDYRPVWRAMAEGLSEGLTGKRLRYDADREEWKKLLITYHACHEAETGECSTFSYWTPDDAWISFTMLQSGHGAFKKNYELIERERKGRKELIYPVWDGEPAYEMMPMTWPVEDLDSFHGTYIVRKRAYWALLAGAFGHTYGHASVWCTSTEKDKNMICRYTWAEAIQSEGSAQMKILRDFMEAYDLSRFEPCQERLLRQAAEEDELYLHEQAAVDKDSRVMLVYFSTGTEERIDLNGIMDDTVCLAFFDPKDGSLTETASISLSDTDGILSVQNTISEDRVLILADKAEKIAVPQGVYGDTGSEEEVRKVFEW
ncbi:MAG: DUF4038 domain-containing protein [Lachnospiraceae bacterium]|nr:DUF4038 domain-containing protein [Lachnospiraceae bacterium]